MVRPPFLTLDPAHVDFQHLEDLATGYWFSEVLFAALELCVFDLLAGEGKDLSALIASSDFDSAALQRLLKALQRLELVGRKEGVWFNSQIANRYLTRSAPDYMGEFLLYRRYMTPGWRELARRVSSGAGASGTSTPPEADYDARIRRYVRALDALARQKAKEITRVRAPGAWKSPVLDMGGGAGALSRALIRTVPEARACLLELPEVIRAARALYPNHEDWERIHCMEGDFRLFEFESDREFGLILMSNFLHAYSEKEAHELLQKALDLLAPGGLVVIHDYFPDRTGRTPQKGALYDLAMMLNTYNGECHDSRKVVQWLRDAGVEGISAHDLTTDSSLILAGGKGAIVSGLESPDWEYMARELGFRTGVMLPADQVATAPWVRMKCKYGCKGHGKNLKCPPNGLTHGETAELLESYSDAMLVEGAPPAMAFHEKLLALEKRAFLAGFHKAFVFGAGPCPVCPPCPARAPCRKPDQARPSMEGSGIDVFETVKNAGLDLKPLERKGLHVKYFGLLLIE